MKNLDSLGRKIGEKAKGTDVWNSKMTEGKVIEARRRYATGRYSQVILAEKYGISLGGMQSILKGKSWKYLRIPKMKVKRFRGYNQTGNPLTKEAVKKRLGKLGLKLVSEYKNTATKIMVKCSCNKNFVTTPFHIFSGHTKSCGHNKFGHMKNSPRWKGFGDLGRTHINRMKRNARIRKLSFKISGKYMWSLFLEQKGKCALSGVDLKFQSCSNGNDGTASLDRINSSKGYIIGNVQWIHKKLNRMKLTMSQNEFIYWCNLISKNSKNKGE